jgi:hypothetical protein
LGVGRAGLYFRDHATEKEIVMNDDVRNEPGPAASDSAEGPLRHFRAGRRAGLQSLAAGVGVAVFASRASAERVHQVAAAATPAVPACQFFNPSI